MATKSKKTVKRTKAVTTAATVKNKSGKAAKSLKAKEAGNAKPREGKANAEGKRQSGLDAAARVLKESGKPMKVKAIVNTTFEKSYWKSDGKTPWATIYSAMIREIQIKGKDSRFKKAGRGLFSFNG